MTRPLTVDQWDRLVEHSVVDKVELIEGQAVMGRYELVFSPEQAADAHALGIRVNSCVDEILAHPELRAELYAWLAEQAPRPLSAPTAAQSAAALTEQHLAAVAAGDRDPRAIPPPAVGMAERLDGPADLLACALWIYSQGGAAGVTLASWATAPDPDLDELSPAQWADRGLDAATLLRIAWRDACWLAR